MPKCDGLFLDLGMFVTVSDCGNNHYSSQKTSDQAAVLRIRSLDRSQAAAETKRSFLLNWPCIKGFCQSQLAAAPMAGTENRSVLCSSSEQAPLRTHPCPLCGKPTTRSARAAMCRRYKVYTKTGDGGSASLYNGERRPKEDQTFAALGDVDELNSALGVAREFCTDVHGDLPQQVGIHTGQRCTLLWRSCGGCKRAAFGTGVDPGVVQRRARRPAAAGGQLRMLFRSCCERCGRGECGACCFRLGGGGAQAGILH